MTREKMTAGIEGATPTELAAMVDYQEGSVVSRTLLQEDIGTLTVFSFDAGQGLSEHTVPFNAFVYILDGEAEIKIGDKSNTVKTGEILLMPGGISHWVQAKKRFKMLLTLFKVDVTE